MIAAPVETNRDFILRKSPWVGADKTTGRKMVIKVEVISQALALRQAQIAPSVGEMRQSRARSLPSVGKDSIMPGRIILRVGNVLVEQHQAIASVGTNVVNLHKIAHSVEMHIALWRKIGLFVGISRQ